MRTTVEQRLKDTQIRLPWCRRCARALDTVGEIMRRKCKVCGHRTRTFVKRGETGPSRRYARV